MSVPSENPIGRKGKRVAIVAGCRTPFARAGGLLATESSLDLARAALSRALAAAPRDRQLRIIEAHGGITRLAAQAPTFNFDAGLLVMEIGGLLASAATPR